MGKKKSKTSKQKQAKAAAKSLKCRVIKEQQLKLNNVVNGGIDNNNVKKGKNKRNNNKISSSSMDNETADFQRQQESMRERLKAEEQQQEWQRKRTKNKQRGNVNKNKKNMFQFQAPTLIVDDAKKSTTQLMAEMTNKAQGWEGISSNGTQMMMQADDSNGQSSSTNTNISLKQVFENSTLLKPEPVPKSRNPFAALGDMSDDDEEEDQQVNQQRQQQQQSVVPLFNFAPATFSFTPSSSSSLAKGTTTSNIPVLAAADETDPDL